MDAGVRAASNNTVWLKRARQWHLWLGVLFAPSIIFFALSGDLLVMYSDGLTEATSKDGEEYGDGRVERLLVTHFASDIDQLTGSLVESWRQFTPDVGSHDDLTVVAIRL